jgi:predicted esterase YcpF (UPF0227 family)
MDTGLTPRVLCLHGFASSPKSWKIEALRKVMAARDLADRLIAPMLPWPPEDALALLEEIIAATPCPLTLVGSSLGGYYAAWLAERHNLKAVLINPAVAAHLGFKQYLGVQHNLHTGERIQVEHANLETLRAFAIERPTPERYLVLLETGDEILDYRVAAAHYAGARQRVCAGGNHSFTRFPEFIAEILEFTGL